jgi:hypothetical protein
MHRRSTSCILCCQRDPTLIQPQLFCMHRRSASECFCCAGAVLRAFGLPTLFQPLPTPDNFFMHRRGASCIWGACVNCDAPGHHLSTSGAKARKSSNRCSWQSFCRLLEPRPESLQIDAPGYHFVDFWSQGQKVFKSMLLAIILSTFGAKARKSSNRWSWLSFCRLMEPGQESLQIDARGSWLSFCRLTSGARPESLQIDVPGHHFVDFWSQGQKVFKSMLLGIMLTTSKQYSHYIRTFSIYYTVHAVHTLLTVYT